MITDENVRTHFDRILFHYDLYPKKIEQNGKVSRIVTNRGMFALKEAFLEGDQQDWYRHVLERLGGLKFPFVPVIPTKYGDYFIKKNRHVYYLMPWFEERDTTKLKRSEAVLYLIANLHQLTVKQQDYSEQMVVSSQELLIHRWSEQQRHFEEFASRVEHHVYQSPFELQFLSHFHQLMARAEEAKSHLKSWMETSKKEKKLRTVLCHGKLSPMHVIMSKSNPVLINFEKAVLDTPVRDLAIFLRRICLFLTLEKDQWYYLLNGYEVIFPIEENEKELLKSYLTYPEPFYKLLHQYEDSSQSENELTYVQRFEHHLFQLNQITYIIDYLNEQPKKPDQPDQTEQQNIEDENNNSNEL